MIDRVGLLNSERAIIINSDDMGITYATNQAIFELLQRGSITPASIMMPCEASNEVGYYYANGIENPLHSLVTVEGFFPHDVFIVEQHADAHHIQLELEAQIQKVSSLGIDITHLDCHAGAVLGLYTGRDFLEIVFDLCEKYELPFNLPMRIVEQPSFSDDQKNLFKQRIAAAKHRGIYLIDDLIALPYHDEHADENCYIHMKVNSSFC